MIKVIKKGGTHVRIQISAAVRRARAGSGDLGISTRRSLVISQAHGELVRLIARGHIERASLGIIYILAIIRVGDTVVTGFEAERIAADEIGPVLHLREGRIVLGGRWEVVREDKTAQRVSGEIGAVRIQFTLPGKVSKVWRCKGTLRTP